MGTEGRGFIWSYSSLDDTDDEELAQCLWGKGGSLAALSEPSWQSGCSYDASVSAGLELNPDPDSESEASEPDGPDEPVIPSPEMDDVKGTERLSSSW